MTEAIPYGRGVHAPEVEALTDDQVLDDVWFEFWMGIKNDLYFFHRDGKEMPERSVLAWLGFLRGELEGNVISEVEYEKLRALLPPLGRPYIFISCISQLPRLPYSRR